MDSMDAKQGAVVILGGAGSRQTDALAWKRALGEAGFEVLVAPYPGHEPTPGDASRMTLRGYAEHVKHELALSKERQPNHPIFLLAHSMGTAIAQILLAEMPGAFAGAVLLTPVPYGALMTPTAASITRFPAIGRGIISALIAKKPYTMDSTSTDKLLENGIEHIPKTGGVRFGVESPRALLDIAFGIGKPVYDTLTDIPMLVVVADDDRVVRPSAVRALAKRINAKTISVSGGHMVPFLAPPPQLLQKVISWMTRQEPFL